MPNVNKSGINFSQPWLMLPVTAASADIQMNDTSDSQNTSATVAFFTGLASFGVENTTDWTSNTYKTIYSHTGQGLIYGMIACQAGGAETTTFEITIDGVLSTITVANANGERAALFCGGLFVSAEFTTSNVNLKTNSSGLDSGTLSTLQSPGAAFNIAPLRWATIGGVPLLQYNNSALVRMKHSASITNSTATAYSGVMVRKGIAS